MISYSATFQMETVCQSQATPGPFKFKFKSLYVHVSDCIMFAS